MFAILLSSSLLSSSSAQPLAAAPVVEERSVNIAQTFNGDGTFYNTYGGYGSCGTLLSDDVPSVALPESLYDAFPGATANPNDNPICTQSIVLSFQGVTQTFSVKDRCAGCALLGSVDMTPAAFSAMGLDESVGRYYGLEWHFAGQSGSSGSGSGSGGDSSPSSSSTPQPTPTTTSTPKPTPTSTEVKQSPTSTSTPALPTGGAGGAEGAGQGGAPSSSSSSSKSSSAAASSSTGSSSSGSGSGSSGSSSSGSGSSSSGSGSSSSGSSSSGSGSTSSSSSGSSGDHTGAYVQCTSKTTWSLCNSVTGQCTPMGSVAAGTECDESKGAMEAIATKHRMMRRRRAQH